jgi:TPR repeat protein
MLVNWFEQLQIINLEATMTRIDEQVAFSIAKSSIQMSSDMSKELLKILNAMGVALDKVAAFKWFKLSAEAGNQEGQNNWFCISCRQWCS